MPLTGAIKRIDPTATAFAYRDRGYQFATVLEGDDADPDGEMAAWAADFWKALDPYKVGVFSNDAWLGVDSAEDVFGDNLPRMREVKARYDPDNVFRHNLNVEPA